MKFFSTVFAFLLFSAPLMSATDIAKQAVKLVPGGRLETLKGDKAKVMTEAGTIVEVELKNDGSLDEASGENALRDTFVPGQGLLSLTEAIATLKKQGRSVQGEWSLDKAFLGDWEYELEGTEQGQQYEYVLNAKTGKLTEVKKG